MVTPAFRLRQARGHGLSSFVELPALLSMKWAHVAVVVAGPTTNKINKINGLGRAVIFTLSNFSVQDLISCLLQSNSSMYLLTSLQGLNMEEMEEGEEYKLLHWSSYFKCCGIAAALFLILAIVALALFFTVFHVRDLLVQMNQAQIPQLAQLVSNGTALADTNITAFVDVSVENLKVASFRYSGSAMEISYGGEVVGEGRILVGRAAACERDGGGGVGEDRGGAEAEWQSGHRELDDGEGI
ncbi:hypothetical protein NL676_010629 [Syzygium grande]|nr:hypothetical protein NL676_010629 [Syzygium grande]